MRDPTHAAGCQVHYPRPRPRPRPRPGACAPPSIPRPRCGRDVLELKMRKLGLQFFVACTQPFAFARALGADVVADLVAAHPTANAFGGGLALLQHLRRNWGRPRRGLPCGLLAALAVGPGLDVENFPTSLLLRSDRCDRLVIDLDRLRDLPISTSSGRSRSASRSVRASARRSDGGGECSR